MFDLKVAFHRQKLTSDRPDLLIIQNTPYYRAKSTLSKHTRCERYSFIQIYLNED